jgi:hypothetical protein
VSLSESPSRTLQLKYLSICVISARYVLLIIPNHLILLCIFLFTVIFPLGLGVAVCFVCLTQTVFIL